MLLKLTLSLVFRTSFQGCLTLLTKRVCQNVHILFFMHKAPTFSSQGFAIS